MDVLAAVLAGAAVVLAGRPRAAVVESPLAGGALADPAEGPLRRWRLLWSLLAGAGAAAFLGGPGAPLVGGVVAVTVGVVAARSEPRSVRLRREEVRRDLPHVVALLGAALRSGAAPTTALDVVRRALPGPAADVLAPVAARLALGADPAEVWTVVAGDPVLGPLGAALARAHRSGAPVVDAVERLSVELGRASRAEVEDRARAVGVRAAVPLGICLLPAFLLLGIVPLVAGLARSIAA